MIGYRTVRAAVAFAGIAVMGAAADLPQRYDVVIRGGRVMDPETGRDETADVGINGASIARISAAPLDGARVIDATGLVVAPGFIDLHSHVQDDEGYRLKALDGVTRRRSARRPRLPGSKEVTR